MPVTLLSLVLIVLVIVVLVISRLLVPGCCSSRRATSCGAGFETRQRVVFGLPRTPCRPKPRSVDGLPR
jgi:hypothetical protein